MDDQFRLSYTQKHGAPPAFTVRLFSELAGLWSAWKKGIAPGRLPVGRGALSPYLLQAFSRLDSAESRAERDSMPKGK